eukprot:11167063-Lingulodinium_polyedra.AAC.1
MVVGCGRTEQAQGWGAWVAKGPFGLGRRCSDRVPGRRLQGLTRGSLGRAAHCGCGPGGRG